MHLRLTSARGDNDDWAVVNDERSSAKMKLMKKRNDNGNVDGIDDDEIIAFQIHTDYKMTTMLFLVLFLEAEY